MGQNLTLPTTSGQKSINEIIPCEVLVEILRYVDFDRRYDLRDVCTHWRDIIDTILGVDLNVGYRDITIWSNHKGTDFQPLEAIPLFGVRRCFFSCVDSPETFSPVVHWKYPELVQHIWIDGFMRPETFNRLTQNLTNLKTLELHFTTLASIPYIHDFHLNGGLQTLEKLTVRMVGVEEAIRFKSVGTGLINGIKLFSLGKFPCLVKLSVSFPLVWRLSFHLSSAISFFLEEHSETIRDFSLYYNRYAKSNKTFDEIVLPDPYQFPRQSVEGSQNLSLRSLMVSCLELNHASMNIFEKLIGEQKQLEQLRCFTKFLSPDVAFLPILTCYRSLTSVQLSLKAGIDYHTGPEPYSPISLAPFEHCVNLERLELIGREADTLPVENSLPDLVNLSVLPSSLRVVTFSDFLLTSADCAELVSKPRLQTLRLYNAGKVGNLGVPFSSVVQILAERKMWKVLLQFSINESSFNDARRSADSLQYVSAFLVDAIGGRDEIMDFNVKLKHGVYKICVSENGPSDPGFDAPMLTVVKDVFLTEEDVSPYISDAEEEAEEDETDAEEADAEEEIDEDDDTDDDSLYEPEEEEENEFERSVNFEYEDDEDDYDEEDDYDDEDGNF